MIYIRFFLRYSVQLYMYCNTLTLELSGNATRSVSSDLAPGLGKAPSAPGRHLLLGGHVRTTDGGTVAVQSRRTDTVPAAAVPPRRPRRCLSGPPSVERPA